MDELLDLILSSPQLLRAVLEDLQRPPTERRIAVPAGGPINTAAPRDVTVANPPDPERTARRQERNEQLAAAADILTNWHQFGRAVSGRPYQTIEEQLPRQATVGPYEPSLVQRVQNLFDIVLPDGSGQPNPVRGAARIAADLTGLSDVLHGPAGLALAAAPIGVPGRRGAKTVAELLAEVPRDHPQYWVERARILAADQLKPIPARTRGLRPEDVPPSGVTPPEAVAGNLYYQYRTQGYDPLTAMQQADQRVRAMIDAGLFSMAPGDLPESAAAYFPGGRIVPGDVSPSQVTSNPALEGIVAGQFTPQQEAFADAWFEYTNAGLDHLTALQMADARIRALEQAGRFDPPAPAAPAATPAEPERIAAATLHDPVTGRTFRGANHGEARREFLRSIGIEDPYRLSIRQERELEPQLDRLVRGFETTTGRLVDDEEALRLARAGKQLNANAELYEERIGDLQVLHSDNLKGMAPRQGILAPGQGGNALDHAIYHSHVENGGATFDPRTGKDMAGSDRYAVATEVQELFDSPPTQADILEFRMRHAEELQDPNKFIGTWDDTGSKSAHGKHELNITELYPDRDSAFEAARSRGEVAVTHLDPDFQFPTLEVPYSRSQLAAVPENSPIALADPQRYRRARNASTRRQGETELLEGLSDTERARFEGLRRDTRERVLQNFSKMPRPEELASAILAGADQRGWYEAAGKAITEAFGDEAPRFTALLASMSPNRSVELNVQQALDVWDEWIKRGRPTDPGAISDLVKGFGFNQMTPNINNITRSLTAPTEVLTDPKLLEAGGLLSGPKVDPFYANLMGNLHRVVLDTHMAKLLGTDPDAIAVISRNLPGAAAVRNAARVAGDAVGVPLEPAEGQEAAWGFAQRVGNILQRHNRYPEQGIQRAEEAIRSGSLFDTPAPSFGEILRQELTNRPPIPGVQVPGAYLPRGLSFDRQLIDQADLLNLFGRIRDVSRGQPLFGMVPVAGLGLGAGLFGGGRD